MTRSIHIATVCLLLLSITAACSKPAQNSARQNDPTADPAALPVQRITSESVVKVVANPVELPAGGSIEAVVRVTIQNGYHVNANPPTYPYLKATELAISPADQVSVGLVIYPKAVEKKFPFAERPLAVYEGVTELKALLKAGKSGKPGQRSLSAKLRIQACDDQVCYPPGTIDLAIPVNVK